MAFQEFDGKSYLKIDIANNYGLDKLNWDERIAWFDDHQHQLHKMLAQAEEPALFYAGILAWEKAQKGEPSGYPISLDATASGIQILAVLAGDRKAAELCNVVDTGRREDAYTNLYQHMVDQLGDTAKIDRKQTKQSIMTSFYGSTATPKRVFGEGQLLDLFYSTMKERAPGAWEINETMLAIWDNTALKYGWVMPDNFHVELKVMGDVVDTVHFLNEPFEVRYAVNTPIDGGRSLGANLVHSLDGMVVREMGRRCMYDPERIKALKKALEKGPWGVSTTRSQDQMVQTLWKHYEQSGFLSARILDHLDRANLGHVSHPPLQKLLASLPKKPFQLIAIHDCFRCLPNYGNDLRRQYNQLLAELAESRMLSHLVSQIVRRPVTVEKLDPNLGASIRQANYALS
jgi:hypothetical protein